MDDFLIATLITTAAVGIFFGLLDVAWWADTNQDNDQYFLALPENTKQRLRMSHFCGHGLRMAEHRQRMREYKERIEELNRETLRISESSSTAKDNSEERIG